MKEKKRDTRFERCVITWTVVDKTKTSFQQHHHHHHPLSSPSNLIFIPPEKKQKNTEARNGFPATVVQSHGEEVIRTHILNSMEARRLAILCSHLRPIPSGPTRHQILRVSGCGSGSAGDRRVEASNLQNDCVFCKIIRGESPCLKLYEDDMCLCILDTNPLSHGHSLIIPKSHFPTLEATPSSVVAAMCSKVPLISNAIMKATASDSFNLLVNNGAAAGQVIFHTHIHIIPRKERDCLWASESLRRHTLKLDKEACQLALHVRQQLSSTSDEHSSQQQQQQQQQQ